MPSRPSVLRATWTANAPTPKLPPPRATLPADVPPDQTVSLTAQVYAPRMPGLYLIQWDMVEENVLWFSWRGSPQATTRLMVGGEPVVNAHPPQVKPADHSTAAPIVELRGDSVAEEIIRHVNEVGATFIVMGQSARSRLEEIIRGSIVNRIMRPLQRCPNCRQWVRAGLRRKLNLPK